MEKKGPIIIERRMVSGHGRYYKLSTKRGREFMEKREVNMRWGKEWGPGWRYFKCEQCGAHWREKSRDATSPSLVSCMGRRGKKEPPLCTEFVSPYDREIRLDWPTDNAKNLLRQDEGIWEWIR